MSNISPRPEQSDDQEIALLTALDNLPANASYAIVKTGPTTLSQVALIGSDEKVKYAADDAAAGYLGDKTVAGDGISLAENADKLQITNSDRGSVAVGTHEGAYDHTLIATALQSESDPVFTASQAFNIDAADITNLSNLSGVNTGDQDLSSYLTSATASTTYLKLDTSNDPLTGNLEISKADPEMRLTDSGNSEYTRLYRTTGNESYLKNRSIIPGTPSKAWSTTAQGWVYGNNYTMGSSGTVSFWFKAYQTSSRAPIWAANNDGSNFLQVLIESNVIRFIGRTGSGTDQFNIAKAFTDTSSWHHFVGIWETNNSRAYLDNVQISSTDTSCTIGFTTSADRHRIGYDSNAGGYWNGALEEFALWRARAITEDERAALWNGGSGVLGDTGVAPFNNGLTLAFHFDNNATPYAGGSSGVSYSPVSYVDGPLTTSNTPTEALVIKMQNGGTNPENAILTFGNTASRTVVEGLTTRFNVAGSQKGQLGTTMAWTIPNTITGSSDAIQFKIVSNATQTNRPFACYQSDGTTLVAGFDNDGNVTLKGGADIRPSANSTTAINFAQADGTDFVVLDSTNKRMRVGLNGAPQSPLEVSNNSAGKAFSLFDNTLAHGVTTFNPTNIFGGIEEFRVGQGGMELRGITNGGTATDPGLYLQGVSGAATPTGSVVRLRGSKKNGTSLQALASGEIVLTIVNLANDLFYIYGNGDIKLGSGVAGYDQKITFDGETNDGILTWMEDEDYFLFSDDILMNSTEQINFNSNTNYVNSDGTDLFVRSANLTRLDGAFASIYVADGSTAQTIPTGVGYTKLTPFTTNGEADNATADAANDKITITKAGRYLVNGSFNFSGDTSGALWRIALFYDGTEYDRVHMIRKIGAAGDVGSASFTGILNSAANKDIDVRARHDGGGDENITMVYSNLNISYIGE